MCAYRYVSLLVMEVVQRQHDLQNSKWGLQQQEGAETRNLILTYPLLSPVNNFGNESWPEPTRTPISESLAHMRMCRVHSVMLLLNSKVHGSKSRRRSNIVTFKKLWIMKLSSTHFILRPLWSEICHLTSHNSWQPNHKLQNICILRVQIIDVIMWSLFICSSKVHCRGAESARIKTMVCL